MGDRIVMSLALPCIYFHHRRTAGQVNLDFVRDKDSFHQEAFPISWKECGQPIEKQRRLGQMGMSALFFSCIRNIAGGQTFLSVSFSATVHPRIIPGYSTRRRGRNSAGPRSGSEGPTHRIGQE